MVGFTRLGKFWGLQRGCFEEGIAFAAATTFQQDDFLFVFGDFAHHGMVFRTVGNRAQRHIDVDVVASGTRELVFAAWNTVACEDVLGVTQVEQCPKLGVAAQDDVATATAVAAVGTALGDVFLPAEVQRTRTSFARSAEYLDVINEV